MTDVKTETPYVAEVAMDYLGIASLNSYVTSNSASRSEMMCSHIGSCLPIKEPDPPTISTLMEAEYGKYTFSKKVKTNVTVLRIIDQYLRTNTQDDIKENPLKLIIFECNETREIDCIDIVDYHSLHQQFGFRYKKNQKAISSASYDKTIKAGTILADSPNHDDYGNYRIGVQANVAFMSVPAVIEDGILMSKGFAARCTTKCYSTISISWNKDEYPINAYGDTDYKICPDIGEYVREDGLLLAIRKHDPIRAITEQTEWALKEFDYYFDKPIYVEAGAKVVNINVITDDKAKKSTPYGMDAQPMKYVRAKRRFYEDIIATYEGLVKKYKALGRKLTISNKFHLLVYEAYLDLGDFGKKDRVTKMYRGVSLDDYRIDITIEYDLVPTIGFKVTDRHGGKGVVCGMEEDENMPVDDMGNRADLVFDPIGRFKRTNFGGLHEHFNAAAARDFSTRLRNKYNITDDKRNEVALSNFVVNNPNIVQEEFPIIRDFYNTISPRMGEIIGLDAYRAYVETKEKFRINDNNRNVFVKSTERPLTVEEHEVVKVLKGTPQVYVPTNNPKPNMQVIEEVLQKYCPQYGPVTYVTCEGDKVRTVADILIGSMYILVLDKTGYNYAAVSSAKTNHLGIPSKLTVKERNSSPVRQAPIRIAGETECRIYANTMGGRAAAEWLEQSNNPRIHRDICFKIMDAENPMNIEEIVDYNVHARGQSRPVVQVTHNLKCGGWELKRGANYADD